MKIGDLAAQFKDKEVCVIIFDGEKETAYNYIGFYEDALRCSAFINYKAENHLISRKSGNLSNRR
jgi:hypothetical protein